jgi:type III pantothenate kinase
MTALLFDLGNTRWKMTRAHGTDIDDVTVGDYAQREALAAALTAYGGPVDSILVASVVDPRTTAALVETAEEVVGLRARHIASTEPMPNLHTGYAKPQQLGVDRLLAMAAARVLTRQSLCVVDAGTAVTIDFVDPDGQHLGGFILPGQRMARDALLANTSIPRDAAIDEQAVLGRDTPTAVALGMRYAVAGIVERFTVGHAALFPSQPVQIVIGGGDADRLRDLLPEPCAQLDHLVLRGLAAVAAAGE